MVTTALPKNKIWGYESPFWRKLGATYRTEWKKQDP